MQQAQCLTTSYLLFAFDSAEEDPKVLLAESLEVGQSYLILLTNTEGLYRYRLDDVYKVVDFWHQAPVVEFEYRWGFKEFNLYIYIHIFIYTSSIIVGSSDGVYTTTIDQDWASLSRHIKVLPCSSWFGHY